MRSVQPSQPVHALSARALAARPFYVMEMAKAAARVAQQSPTPKMLYLNIGEPDFVTLPRVQAAAMEAIKKGQQSYTAATGLPELREAISGWYATRFGLDIAPERIVVTAGASAALLLACLALIEPGDELLMPDPSYPCNQQFVSMAGGRAVLIPSGPEQRFQLNKDLVAAHWNSRTRGVLLASPSNPTGTSIAPSALTEMVQWVRGQGGLVLADEIYLGLGFDSAHTQSALALGEDIVSINSFSKYFAMTGWRLGWLVLPPSLVSAVEILAQHLFICPSTLAQQAALACFHPESLAECEARRFELQARRDAFVPQIEALGLHVPVLPDGAFYVWAHAQNLAQKLGYESSWDLALGLIERAHLAVTPGRDFGSAEVEQYLRFSIASSRGVLSEAVERIGSLIQTRR